MNANGAELDWLISALEFQAAFTEIIFGALLPAQHTQVNPATMKTLQRGRHILLMNEQGPVGLGHFLAIDLLPGWQREAAPGIKFIQRMGHARAGGLRRGLGSSVHF